MTISTVVRLRVQHSDAPSDDFQASDGSCGQSRTSGAVSPLAARVGVVSSCPGGDGCCGGTGRACAKTESRGLSPPRAVQMYRGVPSKLQGGAGHVPLPVASTGFITTTPSEGLATFFFPPPLFLCRHGDIHSPPREGGVCGILSGCCCGLFCSLGGTAAHAPDHKQSIYTQIEPGQRVLSPPIFFWSQIFFGVGE